ncbi:MAG TPA: phage tail tape measure protein [Jatrophihabitantaceae bacterium]
MLPPLIQEMRARYGSVYAENAKVEASNAKMAAGAETSTGRAGRAFNKTAAVGKAAFLGIATGAVAVGYESVKMASKFQSSMTLLQTAGGESAANMKTVSNGVLSLASATGTSTDQLAEGMYTIEKAGIRGADGLKVLRAAAEGAKAENVDLGTATNALTSIMMSYHMSATQATSAENMLIAGAGMAKTSMQSYAGSLASVLPVASAAGISFAQVGGAIATLTQHGTSAEEATQELANTIRSLQAPNQVAMKAMQQLGLNVTDVSKNLGKRGLTGTIDLVTNAIKAKMGPSGLVVVDTFKKSQAAAADAQTELSKMPTSLQQIAKGYLDGTVTQTKWRSELKGMSVEQRQLAQQFAGTVNQSRGFNDLLKSGSPAAQTFAGQLNKVMGGATGMNTALMLGGENMTYFKKATAEVGAAGQKTGKDVSSWAQTQKNLSVQLAQAKQAIEVISIRIGTWLIPKVSAALKIGASWITWLGKHKTVALALAGVIGGALVLAITAWIAKMAIAGATSVINFVKMIALGQKFAATQEASFSRGAAAAIRWVAIQTASLAKALVKGAIWAATSIAEAVSVAAANIASAASTAAAWVAANAVMLLAGGAILLLLAALAFGAYELFKHWSTVWNGIKRIVGDVVGFVKNHLTLILTFLLGPLGTAIGVIVKHWTGFTQGIAAATKWVWSVIKPVFDAIVKVGLWMLRADILALETVWRAVWGAVTATARGTWAVLRPIFSAIVTAGLWLIRREVTILRDTWRAIWTAIAVTTRTAYNVISTIFGWFGKYLFKPLQTAAQGLYNFFHTIFGWIADVVRACWNVIKPIVDAITKAIDAVANGVGKVGGVLKKIGGAAGKVAGWMGFEDGGIVPGGKGSPMLAIVHGGEYVVSNAMQAGTQPIANNVLKNVFMTSGGGGAGGGLTPGGATAAMSGGGSGDVYVQVTVQGNVTAERDLTKSIQAQLLQMGTFRSQTYQPYRRS